MKAEVAYAAYRESLSSRTRGWHVLRADPEHKDRSDEGLDKWIRANKGAEASRYLMGDYDDMKLHTKAGWEAFAENSDKGPAAAWDSYAEKAILNFHQDPNFTLPTYATLDLDQQRAVQYAVERVLAPAHSFGLAR